MSYLVPKNWAEFQHYKNRSPVWIKLHRNLLDDFEFHCLPVASRALAPMLWLLASEYEEGRIPLDFRKLAFRFRMNEKEVQEAVKPLIDNGFFYMERDASESLAECLPREEKRREREEEEREIDTSAAPPKSPRKPRKTRIPDDFVISERVRAWAAEKGHTRLEQHLEYFAGWARAKGAEYTDWDEALMNAIRANWAKLPTVAPTRHNNFDRQDYYAGVKPDGTF